MRSKCNLCADVVEERERAIRKREGEMRRAREEIDGKNEKGREILTILRRKISENHERLNASHQKMLRLQSRQQEFGDVIKKKNLHQNVLNQKKKALENSASSLQLQENNIKSLETRQEFLMKKRDEAKEMHENLTKRIESEERETQKLTETANEKDNLIKNIRHVIKNHQNLIHEKKKLFAIKKAKLQERNHQNLILADTLSRLQNQEYIKNSSLPALLSETQNLRQELENLTIVEDIKKRKIHQNLQHQKERHELLEGLRKIWETAKKECEEEEREVRTLEGEASQTEILVASASELRTLVELRKETASDSHLQLHHNLSLLHQKIQKINQEINLLESDLSA